MKHLVYFDCRELGFIIAVVTEAGAGSGVRFCVAPNVVVLLRNFLGLGLGALGGHPPRQSRRGFLPMYNVILTFSYFILVFFPSLASQLALGCSGPV